MKLKSVDLLDEVESERVCMVEDGVVGYVDGGCCLRLEPVTAAVPDSTDVEDCVESTMNLSYFGMPLSAVVCLESLDASPINSFFLVSSVFDSSCWY